MRLLLGLLFFSVLLTAGSSLQCEYCVPVDGKCSPIKLECPGENAVCMNLILKDNNSQDQLTIKDCSRKQECKRYEGLIGKPAISGIPKAPPGIIIKEVTCSKAPASMASFFPAFLGFLLMKLLF